MIEKKGNIWLSGADAICVTTNGNVKANGEAVMGRGIALEAAKYLPQLPKFLGDCIKKSGNHVYLFEIKQEAITHWNPDLITFPTKNHWMDEADRILILQSALELVTLSLEHTEWKRIAIPRPGCGNGRLNWELDVKPTLDLIFLEDKFEIWRLK
jgi:hypothetical protein